MGCFLESVRSRLENCLDDHLELLFQSNGLCDDLPITGNLLALRSCNWPGSERLNRFLQSQVTRSEAAKTSILHLLEEREFCNQDASMLP